MDGYRLEVLDVQDWFEKGHDIRENSLCNIDGIEMFNYKSGLFLWQPAPAGALAALEQLRKARVKRQESVHVFICPKILEPEWKSQLLKSADLICEIPAGQSFWPKEMFEPLIFALYFPYLSHRPWELRKTPTILDVGKQLQRLWKEGSESTGPVLRELRIQTTRFNHLSPKLVLELLRRPSKFKLPYR